MANGGNPNVAQTSAQAYQSGANAMNPALNAVQTGYNAAQATPYAPMAADLSAYQNPYQQQVIDTTMGDLDRARQMTQVGNRDQAIAGGAFNGSRHGVAEAGTNRAFADVAARTSAGLRSQGFTNAQNASMADAQFGLNRAGALGGFGTQAAGIGSTAAGIGQSGFDMTRAINNDQFNQGLAQQQLKQQVIDRAREQFYRYTGQPQQSLANSASAFGLMPQETTTTTSGGGPGIFDFLTAAAAIAGAPATGGLSLGALAASKALGEGPD